MTSLASLDPAARDALHAEARDAYEAFKARGLKLDMTRGKPSPEQLDLSSAMMSLPGNGDHFAEAGDGCAQLRRPPGAARGACPVRADGAGAGRPDRHR